MLIRHATPAASEALQVAILRSDLLVVPVQPRAVDAWSLSDMADLIDRAQEAREDEGRARLRVLAVLNRAMAHGLAVVEMAPRDPKACEEIELLVSNVFNVKEIAYGHHTAIEAK